MIIRYKYDEMIHKANEIESNLPNLLEADDWEGILSIATVPEEFWTGHAANDYHDFLREVVKRKDVTKVYNLPKWIKACVSQMQERDNKAAAIIKQSLSMF